MAGQGTPATALLTRQKVRHTVHSYQHDPRHPSYGLEAAEALGVAPERVFKTLLAEVDGARLVVGIVPVTAQLDLKALAAAVGGKRARMAEVAAVGGKRARMAEVAAAERATGYVAGGISPLGQRNRLPTVLDASAGALDTLYCSAGRRGLEVELAPADLTRLLDATVAPIAG
ncbi:MAG: aminoacyl-tRNA deacylase [Labedaea sp.]